MQFGGTSLSDAQQIGNSQSTEEKRHFIKKALAKPLPEEPILGHPDGVEAALPGAYKYVSSGYWSAPRIPTGVWGGGRPSKPADS